MPTENRSSNTEMVSVPKLLAADTDRDMLEYLAESLETQTYVCDQCGHEEPLTTFDIASDLRDYMLAFPQAPAQQHQGEPVAWVRFRNGEPDYDGDAVMISNVRGDTLGDGDSWEPVYTRPAPADPSEVERLREEAGGLEQVLKLQAEALKGLIFAARTAGGTAGPDQGLIRACERAEHAISLGGIGRAYMSGADAALSASADSEAKP